MALRVGIDTGGLIGGGLPERFADRVREIGDRGFDSIWFAEAGERMYSPRSASAMTRAGMASAWLSRRYQSGVGFDGVHASDVPYDLNHSFVVRGPRDGDGSRGQTAAHGD